MTLREQLELLMSNRFPQDVTCPMPAQIVRRTSAERIELTKRAYAAVDKGPNAQCPWER